MIDLILIMGMEALFVQYYSRLQVYIIIYTYNYLHIQIYTFVILRFLAMSSPLERWRPLVDGAPQRQCVCTTFWDVVAPLRPSDYQAPLSGLQGALRPLVTWAPLS